MQPLLKRQRVGTLCIAIALSASLPAFGFAQTSTQPPKTSSPAPHGFDKDIDDPSHKRASELFRAVKKLLQDTARARSEASKLPSEDDFLLPPLWTATKESRTSAISDLLNSALEIATDVPIVDTQKKIKTLRDNINALETQIIGLKEKRLTAPDDALLAGILTDTVTTIDQNIVDLNTRVAANKEQITANKAAIHAALEKSDIHLSTVQIDLLLGSVLGGDLIKIVACFEAAKQVDGQLAKLMKESDGDIKSSRRYFAMHTALFAMIVHAQNTIIEKIDNVYLKRIGKILTDLRATQQQTRALLRGKNREDQRRTLLANLKSQQFSQRVATFYRDYLTTQRNQLRASRAKARRDLKIADNTFETVEASFQLRTLMEEARSSFKAIEMLKSPGFDEVFKDKQLRDEFEILSEKLAIPSS